jgi:hypothetical protein
MVNAERSKRITRDQRRDVLKNANELPLATLDAALVKAARAAKLPLITDRSVFPES